MVDTNILKAPWKLNDLPCGCCCEVVNSEGTVIVEQINIDEAAVVVQSPLMYELLKEIEWNNSPSDNFGKNKSCPVCWNYQKYGHIVGCPLEQILENIKNENL